MMRILASPGSSRMSLSPLTRSRPSTAVTPRAARSCARSSARTGLIRARVRVEVALAAGARRRAAASPSCKASAARRLARAGRDGRSEFSDGGCGRRQGVRARDQPRRQGRRVLRSSAASLTHPDWASRRRVRALRLHVRGHQQPLLRADVRGSARPGAAAATRRADRRLRAMAHAHAERRDDGAHARPARDADDARQGSRGLRSPPARSSATRFAAVPIRGKINGAVGNFNAHVAAYPEVDWP